MQLRRGLLGQNILGNDVIVQGVDVAGDVVHLALVDITRRAEGTGRVAIERTKAKRILTLVRRVEQHVARLILQCHQQHGADTGLDILLREVELRTANHRLQGVEHRVVDGRNRNHIVADTQPLGQRLGILDRHIGREGRRHQQGMHILLAERLDGHAGHHRRVDTTRQTYAGLAVAVLVVVVLQTHAGGTIDERGAIHRGGQLQRLILGLGVIDGKILGKALHQEHRFTLAVEHTRRSVIDDLGCTTHLVDQHDILTLDEGQVAHRLVAVVQTATAVLAGIDREDHLGRAVELLDTAQVIAYDDDALVTADRDTLKALCRVQEAHLATCRDVVLAHIAGNLALLHHDGGTDRTLCRQDRRADHGCNAVAMRGDLVECLFTKFQKGGFTQKIEGGGTTHCLLGKEDHICAFAFSSFDCIDNLRGITLDVADGII